MTLIAWFGPTVADWAVAGCRHGSLVACCLSCAVTEAGVGCDPGATWIVIVLPLSWKVMSLPLPDRAQPSGYLIE